MLKPSHFGIKQCMGLVLNLDIEGQSNGIPCTYFLLKHSTLWTKTTIWKQYLSLDVYCDSYPCWPEHSVGIVFQVNLTRDLQHVIIHLWCNLKSLFGNNSKSFYSWVSSAFPSHQSQNTSGIWDITWKWWFCSGNCNIFLDWPEWAMMALFIKMKDQHGEKRIAHWTC